MAATTLRPTYKSPQVGRSLGLLDVFLNQDVLIGARERLLSRSLAATLLSAKNDANPLRPFQEFYDDGRSLHSLDAGWAHAPA